MTSKTMTITLIIGFLHGYVTWNMLFRLIRPIAQLIRPDHEVRSPVSEFVAHAFAAIYLIVCAFVLLQAFGSLVSPDSTRDVRGYLFLGSFLGWICSGIIPRLEAKLRGPQRNKDVGRGDR